MNRYQVSVPEGQSGSIRIERFAVSEAHGALDALRSIAKGTGRFTPPGQYTRMVEGHTVWMSDTPDEIRDHIHVIHRATGRVLIHGLGIGLVVRACLKKPDVTHVTVVEKNSDVIALAGPHYRRMGGKRITIVHDDALTWLPPKSARWDVAWHDIWPIISADNLEQIKLLKRRFGRRAAWQGAWAEELSRRLLAEEKRERWF